MTEQIAKLLALMDPLPLECDGMSRMLSMLMTRDGIAHEVRIGQLRIVGDDGPFHRMIAWHMWIALPDGHLCDLRARMWLGESADVPHGLFKPGPRHQYTASAMIAPLEYNPGLFFIVTGRGIAEFPKLTTEGI